MKYFLIILLSTILITAPFTAAGNEKCPEITPLVTVSPKGIMLKEYINDFFLLSFDISEAGKLSNIVLLDSDSDDHMKSQTLKAAEFWMFKPRIKDNKAVSQSSCAFRFVKTEMQKLD